MRGAEGAAPPRIAGDATPLRAIEGGSPAHLQDPRPTYVGDPGPTLPLERFPLGGRPAPYYAERVYPGAVCAAEAPLGPDRASPMLQNPAGRPEVLPPPPGQYQIPVFRPPGEGNVDVQMTNGRVSVIARNTPLSQVVSMLAQAQGFNVVCAQDISATVSIVLRDVTWNDALTAVLSTAGYTWVQLNGIVRVTSIAAGKTLPPDVQGRCLQVFSLDYASGTDVEKAVKGLLSPAGQLFAAQSSANDSRKPKDVIVVEDFPAFVERIANYVCQVDRPPRQVLIEAQVLEVKLSEDCVHGVNFKHLFSLLGNQVELQLTGMAVASAPQAFFAKVGGGNLDALVELLQKTQNTKTLATPRVLVVDGQEANIQVGEQLGYKVMTTTETSTMQDVKFLDVGVILNVTPHVARDGRVWMKVKPKVSTGKVNTITGLPEEKTSEVNSQVLLDDGQGIVIGGLIQETDNTNVEKLPWLGDLWLIGALFQRRHVEKFRTETIIALVPHVQPFVPPVAERDAVDVMRCQTPLVDRNLRPVPRPWEPLPPDPLRPPDCLRGLDRAGPAPVVGPSPDAVPGLQGPMAPAGPPFNQGSGAWGPSPTAMPSDGPEAIPRQPGLAPVTRPDLQPGPNLEVPQPWPPNGSNGSANPSGMRLPQPSYTR